MILIREIARRLLHRAPEPEQDKDTAQLAAPQEQGQGQSCPHDENDRISAARMGAPLAWICRRCGHREGGA